jgi:hypothetical protein
MCASNRVGVIVVQSVSATFAVSASRTSSFPHKPVGVVADNPVLGNYDPNLGWSVDEIVSE